MDRLFLTTADFVTKGVDYNEYNFKAAALQAGLIRKRKVVEGSGKQVKQTKMLEVTPCNMQYSFFLSSMQKQHEKEEERLKIKLFRVILSLIL